MSQRHADDIDDEASSSSSSSSRSKLPDGDDLHFYRFKNVSLPQKERIYLPMFDATLPYKDIYHCNVDTNHYTGRWHSSNPKQGNQDVWHAIEFANNTKNVWTTAPVMLTKGDAFIGQDLLTYTGVSTHCLFPIRCYVFVLGC